MFSHIFLSRSSLSIDRNETCLLFIFTESLLVQANAEKFTSKQLFESREVEVPAASPGRVLDVGFIW